MICNKCGTYVPENAKFCSNCGEKIIKEPEQINSEEKSLNSDGINIDNNDYYNQNNDYNNYRSINDNRVNYSENVSNNHSSKNEKNFGIPAIILGILSVAFCSIIFFAFPLGVLGIIFGIIQLKKNSIGKGISITGIVTGAVGILLSIIITIFCISAYIDFKDYTKDHYESGWTQENNNNYNDDGMDF